MRRLDIRIDSVAAGGDGVGRSEGLVVFVPRTAPGDLARVEATQHDRLMRGRLVELLEAGPDRTDPPCAHYTVDRCGGCQVQHISYEGQLAAKGTIIRDALQRIGKRTVDRPPVVPSDEPWRYRRKLTLALRRQAGGWLAGLRRYDDPDTVFGLIDCPITDQGVMDDWRAVLAHAALLPDAPELRAAVRAMGGGFSFTVEGGARWSGSGALFDAVPRLRELWWIPDGKGRRLLHARERQGAAGASFVQVNPGVAEALRAWVVGLARVAAPRTAVDAYAGTGDFAAALADDGARVVAIERDPDASRVCAARLPAGSRAVAAPVERAIAGALPADLVIVNPPRGGLDASVADAIGRPDATRHLIYVSCNPATLARDVRRMGRFHVRSLRGFDMFPQTAHVETVCELAA